LFFTNQIGHIHVSDQKALQDDLYAILLNAIRPTLTQR